MSKRTPERELLPPCVPAALRENIIKTVLPAMVRDFLVDRLVYELYGLTEEEIRIVEGAAGAQ